MVDKPKLFKSVNDAVIGTLLLILGIFILTTKHVMLGTADTGSGGVLVRPDVYVRLIGGCIAFFAFVLIVKSINFRKLKETAGFSFALNKEVVLTVVALILYVLALPVVRFFASTFLLLFFLTHLYMQKELSSEADAAPSLKIFVRRSPAAAAYSMVLTIAVFLIFSYVLKVALP